MCFCFVLEGNACVISYFLTLWLGLHLIMWNCISHFKEKGIQIFFGAWCNKKLPAFVKRLLVNKKNNIFYLRAQCLCLVVCLWLTVAITSVIKHFRKIELQLLISILIVFPVVMHLCWNVLIWYSRLLLTNVQLLARRTYFLNVSHLTHLYTWRTTLVDFWLLLCFFYLCDSFHFRFLESYFGLK